MEYGYTGKILRINLSENKIELEKKDELFYRKYMGGACLGAYYLLKELPPKIDPFSEENIIIFSTSPTTGAPCPGLSMHSVISKSPLTNLVGESVTPGYLGTEIKKAGYDAIVIKGKAKTSSYIFIYNDKVEIRDASKIWGHTTSKSYDLLMDELEDKNTSIALIGPAGENLIRFASIVNDNIFFSSRCGLGAIMGSKNIKALCIKGSNDINVFDIDKINNLSKYFEKNFLTNPINKGQHDRAGIAGFVKQISDAGMFSTRNFKSSSFQDADKIDGNAIVKKFSSSNINCYRCFGGCKKRLKGLEKIGVDPRFGHIELESLGASIYNLQINNIDAALKIWNSICENGLDGTSLGVTISFALECFENGLISKKDTNGIELRWGKEDSILKLINMIVSKEGIGALLANGTRFASAKIKESEKYAMHVKGMEMPVHEPRVKQMLGLGYAVSPIGPYYTVVEHDTDFDFNADQLFLNKVSSLTIYERLPSQSLSEKKVRMFYLLQPGFSMLDALCCCIFAFSPARFFNFHHLVEIVSAVTGWESSLFELFKLGEKRINMYKLFALREGVTKEDDMLPDRLFEPIENGPKKGIKINKDNFLRARDLYYKMSNWDENGAPTYSKLLELDLLEFI
ncbi:MAG: aldehyde ferredoxin oxidoreductase family protein [Actinobacteria bacterium]|nr:aldehyde ferredoxin oxidoreductase family protein [Actinomycetota bacterium]